MESTLEHQNEMPSWVWGVGVVLGLLRLLAFFAFASPTDVAQWQLSYILLWFLDLPVSLIYFFVLPPPIGEAFVGPIWWALLPYLIWKLAQKYRRRRVAK